MLSRVRGILESVEGTTAVIVPSGDEGVGASGFGLALEVLLPAYAARRLIDQVGQPVTLHTYLVLESPNQGSSFEPRLIGFLSPLERSFFDLFTTVKGIGNRKALKALAEPIGVIAAAAHRGDAKSLTKLPEIGKRLAETIIVELKGKLDPYLGGESLESVIGSRGAAASLAGEPVLSQPEEEAVEVLVRLGEQRHEAARKVAKAVERAGKAGESLGTPDAIVSAVFAGR